MTTLNRTQNEEGQKPGWVRKRWSAADVRQRDAASGFRFSPPTAIMVGFDHATTATKPNV